MLPAKHPGAFITFEGPDGAGKTTNIRVMQETLEERGYSVVITREPGGTPVGEKLREILLNDYVDSITEMLLMAAARREHLVNVIKPLMGAGNIVISDRFVDSSYAYQGFGRQLLDETYIANDWVLAGFQPNHTLFFDIPLEESIRRLNERQRRSTDNDRLDKEKLEFKHQVYLGYQHALKTAPNRMVRIDALPEPEVVAEKVRAWVRQHFPVVGV